MWGFYKFACCLTWPFIGIRYPHKVRGRENIPEGAALICPCHSSNTDPLLAAYAFRKKNVLHFMAKAELFRIPILGPLVYKLGSFPVERGKSDVNAIKCAMKFLKNGEKVCMFPEGKRVWDEENTKAKTGAVILAVRMGVPVVPVYIARKKPWFRRVPIVIGEPYMVDLDKKTATHEDYKTATVQLMEKINALKAVAQ